MIRKRLILTPALITAITIAASVGGTLRVN